MKWTLKPQQTQDALQNVELCKHAIMKVMRARNCTSDNPINHLNLHNLVLDETAGQANPIGQQNAHIIGREGKGISFSDDEAGPIIARIALCQLRDEGWIVMKRRCRNRRLMTLTARNAPTPRLGQRGMPSNPFGLVYSLAPRPPK
jgi:hypothetical protein